MVESDVNQSDLDKFENMIKDAPNLTLNEYTRESYANFQITIKESNRIAYSSNPGQAEVKDTINKSADA